MKESAFYKRAAAEGVRRQAKLKDIRKHLISFMSDTKWLKTLRALSAVEGEIAHLDWKFIDEARMYRTSVPKPGDLDATRLKDGPFQPFEYREVEWIDIATKDTTAIRKALAPCGKRLIEEFPAGVRIVGYREEPN